MERMESSFHCLENLWLWHLWTWFEELGRDLVIQKGFGDLKGLFHP